MQLASPRLMPRRTTVDCINPDPDDTGHTDEQLRTEVAEVKPGAR